MIASGALLIAVSEDDVAPVCEALTEAGIAVAPIARAVPPEHGLRSAHQPGCTAAASL